MEGLPRWLSIASTFLAVVILSFAGRYYHQWLVGVVAAAGVMGLAHLLNNAVHRRSLRRRRSPANQQAVIVRLAPARGSGAHTGDLSTLEDELMGTIDAQALGAYDGNEIGESGAVLYMYGADAERLFKGVERILRSSVLCRNAQVLVRPGPPGTPTRSVSL